MDVDFDKTAEASDLYDAVLTGLVNRDKFPPKKVVAPVIKKMPVKEVYNPDLELPLYIGNFPWWTSDADIITMALTLGVRDIKEIKFIENKANGQSRGFAHVVVTSQESMKRMLDKIPHCKLNGEQVDCLIATRTNFDMFEAIANKRIPQRVISNDSVEEFASGSKITTIVSQEPNSPSAPYVPRPHLPASNPPPATNPYFNPYNHPLRPPPLPNVLPNMNHIPPPSPHMFPPPPLFVSNHPHPNQPRPNHPHPNHPHPNQPRPNHPHPNHQHPNQPHPNQPHPNQPHPNQLPPNLHINPAFFPPGYDGSKAYSQQRDGGKPAPPAPNRDFQFEELMNRNRAVASSAITKAVSGATTGDLRMAMETLLTAIAVIKQSRVYADDRCQSLVTSLKDCLVSIQGNYSSRTKNHSHSRDEERDWDREHDRERDREPDRERDREHDRERDREPDRERDREQHDRERGREPDRERGREPDRERGRERGREPDRERDRGRDGERGREDSHATGWEGGGGAAAAAGAASSRRHRERSPSGERDREQRARDRDDRSHRDYRYR